MTPERCAAAAFGVRAFLAALVVAVVLPAVVVLPPGNPVAASTRAGIRYYVSLGDSYSVGYQPGKGATPGYTAYVAAHTGDRLVNFGCGGATTTSIIDTVGCPDPLPHTGGAVHYPTTTQAAAAEAFIVAHRRHVALVTVSIGGNDVTACASASNPISCVATAVSTIDRNVTALADGLRRAAGRGVPIIGLTYPDVILGEYVYPTLPPTAARVGLAKLSVTAFRSLINPTLKKAYARANADFVDVTAATGAYGPLTKTVRVAHYGVVPEPVATVCALTWFCAQGNIHATTAGYRLIGKLVVARVRQLSRTSRR
ncbi:MAG: SGNH/GDSL hydrolase family protein [Acidimicrobiales bacterium]